MPPPITILLADDHAIVRQGLRALLNLDARVVVVGEARDGSEAVRLARELQPDVILMDIAMPVLNGLDATRQILAARPAARVIILTAHSDDVYVEHMVNAGVAGFLEKQTSAEVLGKAVCDVAAGKTCFRPSIVKRPRAGQATVERRDGTSRPGDVRLTAREREVLQMVATGSANKQMAAVLGISIKTVEKHRQHLMDKLQIHETAGLTRYALRMGMLAGGVRLTVI